MMKLLLGSMFVFALLNTSHASTLSKDSAYPSLRVRCALIAGEQDTLFEQVYVYQKAQAERMLQQGETLFDRILDPNTPPPDRIDCKEFVIV